MNGVPEASTTGVIKGYRCDGDAFPRKKSTACWLQSAGGNAVRNSTAMPRLCSAAANSSRLAPYQETMESKPRSSSTNLEEGARQGIPNVSMPVSAIARTRSAKCTSGTTGLGTQTSV